MSVALQSSFKNVIRRGGFSGDRGRIQNGKNCMAARLAFDANFETTRFENELTFRDIALRHDRSAAFTVERLDIFWAVPSCITSVTVDIRCSCRRKCTSVEAFPSRCREFNDSNFVDTRAGSTSPLRLLYAVILLAPFVNCFNADPSGFILQPWRNGTGTQNARLKIV